MARTLGCIVHETHAVGGGFPDAVCFHPRVGWVFLVEVKADKGSLTPDQQKFHAQFPVTVWRTLADVCQTLGVFPQ